jgi:imidazolonepropionase-like amidohydrolase
MISQNRRFAALKIALGLSILLSGAAIALAQNPPAAGKTYIQCGALFDGRSGGLRKNAIIEVENGKIAAIRDSSSGVPMGDGSTVIKLPNETCIPGMIDAHTHLLLQGDITEAQYAEQLLKWPVAYRAIRATVSAKNALMNGFTTIRDLETEGAGYADVSVRDAINQGYIPGPRMKVATRALDVTGAYPLLGYSPEVPVPHGVQVVDGPEEARQAVREQISYGADWIKVYVDRGYFLRPDGVLDDIPTFTPAELRAIVDEAHRERHKVAAHAMGLHGVHNAVEAGVDSIEHGVYIAPEDLKAMAAHGTYYVPTLFVVDYVAEGRAKEGFPIWAKMGAVHADTFQRAMQAGVKIAFGTDAGGFDWSINEAKEFPYMVKDGMTPAQALEAATASAAALLGMENEIGTLEPGKFADIVAVPGDPLEDVDVLEHANFVMKGGVVYKKPE